jgi:hypothetical protein
MANASPFLGPAVAPRPAGLFVCLRHAVRQPDLSQGRQIPMPLVATFARFNTLAGL